MPFAVVDISSRMHFVGQNIFFIYLLNYSLISLKRSVYPERQNTQYKHTTVFFKKVVKGIFTDKLYIAVNFVRQYFYRIIKLSFDYIKTKCIFKTRENLTNSTNFVHARLKNTAISKSTAKRIAQEFRVCSLFII